MGAMKRLALFRDLFAAPPDPGAPRHLPSLDGARGLAAMMVLVSHLANAGLLPGALGMGFGQMGVHLFFVLSGFLMAYLYADREFSRAQLRRFTVHRVGRVLPLFYLVVLLSMVFANGAGPIWLFPLEGWRGPAALGLIHAQDVLWTIPVEVQFYVLFAGMWYMFHRSQFPWWIVALLLAQALVALGIALVSAERLILPFWLHSFLVGTLVGYLFRRHHEWLLRLAKTPLARAAGWAILLLLVLSPPQLRAMAGLPVLPTWIDPLSFGIPVLVFLAALASLGPFRLLASRPAVWLGGISYAIYLLHRPVLNSLLPLAENGMAGPPGVAALVTGLSIGLAACSTYLFERPVQRWINRFGTRGASPAASG